MVQSLCYMRFMSKCSFSVCAVCLQCKHYTNGWLYIDWSRLCILWHVLLTILLSFAYLQCMHMLICFSQHYGDKITNTIVHYVPCLPLNCFVVICCISIFYVPFSVLYYYNFFSGISAIPFFLKYFKKKAFSAFFLIKISFLIKIAFVIIMSHTYLKCLNIIIEVNCCLSL